MAFDFAREWPFFPDDEKLRIFEPRANVAILIGHTATDVGGATKVDAPLAVLLERLPAKFPTSQVAAIGTIATLRDGVERVVQNLLTNPYITVLVLCGDDSPVFTPLEGIRCLYANGVDEGRHVIPGETDGRAAKIFARDALATLSHEEIACFRRRELEIVDARGALDPISFFTDVERRLPMLVRPVATPSWRVLEEIDPYRWRPRTIQVPSGMLEPFAGLRLALRGPDLVVDHDGPDVPRIVANGKADGRAQRAIHEVLRRGLLGDGATFASRLVAFGLAAERAVLAAEFPEDAARVGGHEFDVATGAVCADVADGDAAGAVVARASPLRLDPTGFFKIHVAYEQGTLAADYHEAGGRHVETLAARSAEDLLAAIVGGTYVGGDDETRAQHLAYLAVQIARADFALRTGLRFEEGQGLSSEARKNVGHHLVAATVIAGESLEDTWLRGLTHLREEGLLTTTQKGRVAEAWCTLFGIPEMGAMAIPEAYPASEEHIAHYAAELLAPAPDVRARGDYTYGDRTCHYFFDQIAATGNALTADPTRVYVNQRWVPEVDLPAQAHHRPCLVFDLWFRWGGRLHTLQIARSHDVYGGLPQNALGIARGWAQALARASGLALGDLWFCSISNNFRVGDDAENVRRALRGGVHAAPHVPTLPAPRVEVVEEDACRSGGAEGPIRVRHIIDVAARPVGTADEILAATPILRERLLRYRGELDQVATVIARLRTEAEADGREHSNSLLLSPRDPRVDRSAAATPLVCLQLRRQLGRLHAAAILLGPEAPALTPTLLDLQRHIATAAAIFVGSATFIHVADPPE
ncbi:MAG: hypothetical protein E6J72_14470 [Deltaproteobacteria bacterium]|nr:MAG: hypothetical protein E6J72_14470 [Deltaproteobacteria bacterium]